MRKIVNITICSSGKVHSGGEKCFVELVKQFDRLGFKQDVYLGYKEDSTDLTSLKQTNISFLINEIINIQNKFLVLCLYIFLFIKSLFFLKKFNEPTIIISHSDAWPDVVFAYLLKKKNPKALWIAINHMLLPEKKYDSNPFFIRFYNFINQKLFFIFQKGSNLLVSVNDMYKNELKKYNNNSLIINYGKEKSFEKIKYFEQRDVDLCFIGRFFYQKGVYHLPEICEEIDNLIEDKNIKITFFLIGSINSVAKDLKKSLEKISPRFDFRFVGFKSGDEKYELLSKSKLFIFPSVFESFGIVYLDAISVGTPVIEYDLKCFNGHKHGVIKVPFLNNKMFAKKAVEVLTNKGLFETLSIEGYNYSKRYSWENTAISILNKIDLNL